MQESWIALLPDVYTLTGRSCFNAESSAVEDSFDTNKESHDTSHLELFTCTQSEEVKEQEEKHQELYSYLLYYDEPLLIKIILQ